MNDARLLRVVRRRKLLQLLKDQFNVKAGEFADHIRKPRGHIYRLFSKTSVHARDIGDDLARDIEKRMGLPPGWLDDDEDSMIASTTSEGDEVIELLNSLQPEDRKRYIDTLRWLAKRNRIALGLS